MRLVSRAGWLIFVLSLVAGLSLIVAACGGGDDEEEDSGEPTTTEEAGNEDEESTPGPGNGDGGEGDAASDLGALTAEYGDFTGVVTYETSEFAGDAFTSLKIYRDDGRSRVDFQGADGSGTFLTNADGSFVCSESQCIKYPGGQGVDPTAAFTALISPETVRDAFGEVPEGVDVEESSEKIAGIEATCYDYSGELDDAEAGDESGQVCFSESGILLRLGFSAASGGGKFEAVEAEEGVSDSDFEPPFEVVDLGELGQ